MRRLLIAILFVAGCPPPRQDQLPPPPGLCFVAGRPKTPKDTIRIVLPEPVDPGDYAVGTSDVELFLFTQVYEPLVRRDCAGEVEKGLAEKWSQSADTTWRLSLRSDAQFSDGARVTGSEVATILKGVAPAGWRISGSGNEVAIRAPNELLPGALSNPRYAIAKAAGAGGWPLSTAGSLSPVPSGVMFKHARGVMLFTWPAGADARDLLESGTDAVVTNQPAALEFASVRGTVDAIPLPWSRTYVLAVPPGQTTAFAQGGRPWSEAVRGDARVATGPFWWTTAPCPNAPTTAPSQAAPPPTRVVYPQGDSVARGLAERLVARGVQAAEALPPAELRAAVAAGGVYTIVPLARSVADQCATLDAVGLAGRPAETLLSLVDTRFQFIIQGGRFGVTRDGNGIPRLQQ